MAGVFPGYGNTIRASVRRQAPGVHRSQDARIVILGVRSARKDSVDWCPPYHNRLISIVTIENRKIVHWRDYMDSLAAWTALNSSS